MSTRAFGRANVGPTEQASQSPLSRSAAKPVLEVEVLLRIADGAEPVERLEVVRTAADARAVDGLLRAFGKLLCNVLSGPASEFGRRNFGDEFREEVLCNFIDVRCVGTAQQEAAVDEHVLLPGFLRSGIGPTFRTTSSGGAVTGGNRHCLLDFLDSTNHFGEWLHRISTLPDWFIHDVCNEARNYGLRANEAAAVRQFLKVRRNARDRWRVRRLSRGMPRRFPPPPTDHARLVQFLKGRE